MSTKDIDKGRDWFIELHKALSEVRHCIICVTPDIVRSPWIYYEVGAIVAKDPEVLICPYLVGVSPSMLSDGPLGKRQCTNADEDDTWELIKSFNKNVLSSRHDLTFLEGKYRDRWPGFFEKIQPVLQTEEDFNQGFVQTDADNVAGVNLSPEARTLLIEASQDRNGTIIYHKSYSHTLFQTNDKELCQDQSARSVARWKGALETLLNHKLLEDRGHKGQVLNLTDRGFEVADLLK